MTIATAEAQLPLWGSRKPLELRYAEWRTSAEGMEVASLVKAYALNQAAAGHKRVSVNQLFEGLRASPQHYVLDNSFRAFMARELVEKYPQLVGVIRVKKRVRDA